MSETLHIDTANALDIKLEIAGAGARAHAFVIDWHIRLLLALVWLLLLGLLLIGSVENWGNRLDASDSEWLGIIVFMPPVLIYTLYHPVLEIVLRGHTPGKRMAGIRIASNSGQTPTIGALLIRNIFRLVDSLPMMYILGLGFTMFTKRSVRIGDIAAGTLLVYEEKISNKALQDATNLALNSNLSVEDQSLLLEILERWTGLESDVRYRIGVGFLEKTGEPLPDFDSAQSPDKAIHQALLKLRQNS